MAALHAVIRCTFNILNTTVTDTRNRVSSWYSLPFSVAKEMDGSFRYFLRHHAEVLILVLKSLLQIFHRHILHSHAVAELFKAGEVQIFSQVMDMNVTFAHKIIHIHPQ